jgi:peptidoglycan hydrolase-like protein with peptidoglycan-binding domain
MTDTDTDTDTKDSEVAPAAAATPVPATMPPPPLPTPSPVDARGIEENRDDPILVPDPKDTIEVPVGGPVEGDDGEVLPPDTVELPVAPVEGITRPLALDDFIGTGSRIKEIQIINAARELGIEPELLLAFTKVEAPKGPYLPDGRPTMLFEAHVFSRNTKPAHKFDKSHPMISSKSWNPALYGKGGANQYARLMKAMALDARAALMACSWGSWQVLGENYSILGFKTVQDMVLFCVESEANQFEVFLRFVKTKKGLLAALRSKDFDTIAYLYNGSGYRKNAYDDKIEAEYKNLTSNFLRRGSQGPKVVTLQKLLNTHGADPQIKVDGWFGVATDAAVRALQSRWGIVIDGVVGPETYERLASERIPTPDENPLTSKRAIGAAATAATGVAAVTEGISSIQRASEAAKEVATLERLRELQETTTVTKEVIGTAKDAAERVVGVQADTSIVLIIVGVVVIGIAMFFAWTKYVDQMKAKKKADGAS